MFTWKDFNTEPFNPSAFRLCWSTGARGLMQGLLGIRIPYILAFMTVTALRFLRPVLVNGYRKALILSMSLQSRAFSPQQSGMHKSLVPLSPGAYIAGWTGFIVVTGILVGKVLYGFYL